MVVVDDASQHVPAFHRTYLASTFHRNGAVLLDTLVWATPVVVVHMFAQHTPRMSFPQYQHPVQTLFSCAPNPAFSAAT
jgi:hypothetical protein